jgi:serine/threonine-protein kinase RsbW
VADHVELDVPLASRYASTVRAVAASVGAELGFSVDDIDDLRLGVNEAVSILSDVDDAAGARLHIRFESGGGAVTVRCSRRGVDEPVVEDDIDVLARRILDAVVDEYSVDSAGQITVVKRSAAAGG